MTGAPADADRDSPGETRAGDTTPLLVALSRPLLATRLAALSAVAPPGLTVVTTVARNGEGAPTTPDGVRIVEVDPDADHRVAMRAVAGPSLAGVPEPARKILRLALAPRAALRRRRLFAERPRMRRATLQSRTLEAWRAHREQAPTAETAWIVACDAEDVDAAAQAIAAGARLAPGGLRWLADRWSIGAYHGRRAEQ